jgi:hypothetical protein
MSKKKLIQGIASLFKAKDKDMPDNVQNIFRKNLEDSFGRKEVEEAVRILGSRNDNPELAKLFYKEGESLQDEMVNLLEARYMGSTRLQAHPLSFNTRGPGAADRYLKLNETGERLTDLPGGPGDKAMYGKHFGEMSETTAGVSGRKVYETPPTVFDEGSKLTDMGKTIEGRAVQDSLYEKTIADIPLINRMMKETGKSETEIREAIVDMANEGYQAGSPKRMKFTDDDSIRAFVSNKETIPGDKEDFVTEMMERLGAGPQSVPEPQPAVRRILEKQGFAMPEQTGDDILKNMKQMEAETKAMTEIAKAEQAQIGEAIDTFSRMLDDGEEPSVALEYLKNAMKRTKQADGGRIGAKTGGLMALLKAMGMKAPDKIADKKQIENVIRDPDTDLERIYKDNPMTGTRATPKDRMTIDEIRDMIQRDPRYDKLTAAQMDMVVRRETIRADFAYNMGVKPEEVGDDIVDMLLMEGYDRRFGFKQGGGIDADIHEQFRTPKPKRSRDVRMSYVNKMKSDLEGYMKNMRMGKQQGGLIPPERGPMSEGMGTLYRSK